MGDNWDHDIVVEKILLADPTVAYPVCVAGARNGPLEDSGGTWGYERLLEALADPKHPGHEERKEWVKEVFGVRGWDGDDFDRESINKRLAKLRPKPKRTRRRQGE